MQHPGEMVGNFFCVLRLGSRCGNEGRKQVYEISSDTTKAVFMGRTGAGYEGSGPELTLRRTRSSPVVHYATLGNSLPLLRLSSPFSQMRRQN